MATARPGGHQRPAAARGEVHRLPGAQVVAGVVVVLLAREREVGIEPLSTADLAPASALRSRVGELARAASVGELDRGLVRGVVDDERAPGPTRTRARW